MPPRRAEGTPTGRRRVLFAAALSLGVGLLVLPVVLADGRTLLRTAAGIQPLLLALPVGLTILSYAAMSRSYQGIAERSPFNFILTTDVNREGSTLVISAQLTTDPSDGRSVVFDYWDIGTRGSAISGTLTDSWAGYGLALNAIRTTAPLIPCQTDGVSLTEDNPIAEGARLGPGETFQLD